MGKWAKYPKAFRVKWLEDPLFKKWLSEVPEDGTKAKCKICNSFIRAQRNDITKHGESKKHKSNMVKVNLEVTMMMKKDVTFLPQVNDWVINEMAYTKISSLPTPCFLVDVTKLKENDKRMKETCKKLQLQLRPHMKTHKTVEAAVLQTDGLKRRITVSTLAEAEFYAEDGFDDILLAYPITENKMERCLALITNLEKFHILVSNTEGLDIVEKMTPKLPSDKKWSIVLEVDAGYNRTGFYWNSMDLNNAASRVHLAHKMHLDSLYIHCGNAYGINTSADREKLQKDVILRTKDILSRLADQYGIECPVSTGSTPTCSMPLEDNKHFSEFHPGNYIFYDYEQYLLGSCRQQDIACRVMTRVVDHKPEQHTIVVDCGFTALSHDGMRQRPQDFCLIEGESNLRLVGMSQEVGKITAKEGELDCKKYPIGTVLFIIPYHSCATAALHDKYYVHLADEIQTIWTPVRGW